MSTDALDELTQLKRKTLNEEKEAMLGRQRDLLRNNYAISLREAGDPAQSGPASMSNRSFAVGPVHGFTGVKEDLPMNKDSGQLSKTEFDDLSQKLLSASKKPDATSRDAEAGRAAKTVANSWSRQNGGPAQATPSLLREARAQAVFATTEIAKAAGIPPGQAQIVGYAFERALEKEGFKVLASHAIDKAADGVNSFRASSSSTAVATGNRAKAEAMFDKSANWLANKGVTTEALKGVVKNHTGKFLLVAELAQNPETLKQVSMAIAKSDGLVDAMVAINNDKELKKAVGNLTMAAGDSLSTFSKGAGSAAILTGAALKGESVDEVGRHAFRMGMAILGGAAGGIAAGTVSAGFGAIGGAVVGQMAGDKLADKILDAYDSFMGNSRSDGMKTDLVSKQEINQSKDVIADRLKDNTSEKTQEMAREMVKSPGKILGMDR